MDHHIILVIFDPIINFFILIFRGLTSKNLKNFWYIYLGLFFKIYIYISSPWKWSIKSKKTHRNREIFLYGERFKNLCLLAMYLFSGQWYRQTGHHTTGNYRILSTKQSIYDLSLLFKIGSFYFIFLRKYFKIPLLLDFVLASPE